MKKIVVLTLIFALTIGVIGVTSIGGCKKEVTATTESAVAEAAATTEEAAATEAAAAEKQQEYVWANAYISLPYFVHNDYFGLDAAAKDFGVIVRKAGPQTADVPALIAAIEAEIAKKPDGLCTVGWDATVAVAINKCIDAGIPVVTVDTDVPDSKRLAYVGSDWAEIGRMEARRCNEAIADKKGKIGMIGQLTSPYNVEQERGFKEVMKELNPTIEILGTFDDEHDPQKVIQIATDLINANPDLLGIVGFDSLGVPGIATAIKETNKKGTVWACGIGNELENLKAVQDGFAIFAMWPNAKIRTYYAIKLLYDYVNTSMSYTANDKENGIKMIPDFVDCGVIVATSANIDDFIEAKLKESE
jgi:ABC-type sugar transport system substrate-binding protein